jgi:hypothetical protein
VPKGSQWSLTLSDQPNFRAADADIPASDRGAAVERGMFPRQLSEARRA